VILTGLLALAAGLRVALLGGHSFSYDEIFVVGITRHTWQDILPALQAGEFHPPLYYLLMKTWVGIAGTSEGAFRIPSVCCGIASVGLTYALARRVSSEPVGLLSAFLVSTAPFHIMASQEARMYALLGMLVLASTLTLIASVERGGTLRWAGYVVTTTLMLYTQYIGFSVLLAAGIWVAGSERRYLGKWMIAVAAIAILYAPWAPSLRDQAVHLHGVLGSLGRPVTGLDVGDLLGLLAFGGSLFGMASYLFPGRLEPAKQFVVLLPFLAILWRGAVALSSDRRRLLFLGLPAVTIGVAFALALANRYYYPRWLSFLLPFYAIVLARGLFDVADRIRAGRSGALALLTAGLLLYSASVLGRYYSDPGFDHFQWRAAASLVEHQVEPGDFFLYVNNATRIAFTYYFHEPHPSLTLTSADLIPSGDQQPRVTIVRARELAARYSRVWLIVSIPFTRNMQERLFPALAGAFRVVGARQFTGTGVYLLTANPP